MASGSAWLLFYRLGVERVLSRLSDDGARIAGCALSQVDAKQHASYGYSDSGYYYGDMKKYYSRA